MDQVTMDGMMTGGIMVGTLNTLWYVDFEYNKYYVEHEILHVFGSMNCLNFLY